MKTCLTHALHLFDAYSDMADEEQSAALAALRRTDPALHDALVHLLVTDALDHEMDVPPWSIHAPGHAMPGDGVPDGDTKEPAGVRARHA
nr:hypothetical protein [uncultured Pseudoxanthomonas sp.]